MGFPAASVMTLPVESFAEQRTEIAVPGGAKDAESNFRVTEFWV
jgi:hypothetical protein